MQSVANYLTYFRLTIPLLLNLYFLSLRMAVSSRYLETYHTYEQKQADVIQERIEGDFMSRLTDVLTTVRSVNRYVAQGTGICANVGGLFLPGWSLSVRYLMSRA